MLSRSNVLIRESAEGSMCVRAQQRSNSTSRQALAGAVCLPALIALLGNIGSVGFAGETRL